MLYAGGAGFVSALIGTLVGTSRTAQAQVWPQRPVTIIVPFTAGGNTDTIARMSFPRMRAMRAERSALVRVSTMGLHSRVVKWMQLPPVA